LAVLDDALHVPDGKRYTSAGISVGMDRALSLVKEDLGREVALAVAKCMVLLLKRPGGHAAHACDITLYFRRAPSWIVPKPVSLY
jgi:transcriptional regulator GlxA family with amidase domain